MRSNSVIWDFFLEDVGAVRDREQCPEPDWGYRFRFLGMLGSLEWWHCDRPNKAGSLVTSSVLWPLVSHSQYSGDTEASLRGPSNINYFWLTLRLSYHIFGWRVFVFVFKFKMDHVTPLVDMTLGNGHRTQNRATCCHSPGGWDYTSTAGAWTWPETREKRGDWNKKMQIFTQQRALQQKCWPWIANQTRDCFSWSYY